MLNVILLLSSTTCVEYKLDTGGFGYSNGNSGQITWNGSSSETTDICWSLRCGGEVELNWSTFDIGSCSEGRLETWNTNGRFQSGCGVNPPAAMTGDGDTTIRLLLTGTAIDKKIDLLWKCKSSLTIPSSCLLQTDTSSMRGMVPLIPTSCYRLRSSSFLLFSLEYVSDQTQPHSCSNSDKTSVVSSVVVVKTKSEIHNITICDLPFEDTVAGDLFIYYNGSIDNDLQLSWFSPAVSPFWNPHCLTSCGILLPGENCTSSCQRPLTGSNITIECPQWLSSSNVIEINPICESKCLLNERSIGNGSCEECPAGQYNIRRDSWEEDGNITSCDSQCDPLQLSIPGYPSHLMFDYLLIECNNDSLCTIPPPPNEFIDCTAVTVICSSFSWEVYGSCTRSCSNITSPISGILLFFFFSFWFFFFVSFKKLNKTYKGISGITCSPDEQQCSYSTDAGYLCSNDVVMECVNGSLVVIKDLNDTSDICKPVYFIVDSGNCESWGGDPVRVIDECDIAKLYFNNGDSNTDSIQCNLGCPSLPSGCVDQVQDGTFWFNHLADTNTLCSQSLRCVCNGIKKTQPPYYRRGRNCPTGGEIVTNVECSLASSEVFQDEIIEFVNSNNPASQCVVTPSGGKFIVSLGDTCTEQSPCICSGSEPPQTLKIKPTTCPPLSFIRDGKWSGTGIDLAKWLATSQGMGWDISEDNINFDVSFSCSKPHQRYSSQPVYITPEGILKLSSIDSTPSISNLFLIVLKCYLIVFAVFGWIRLLPIRRWTPVADRVLFTISIMVSISSLVSVIERQVDNCNDDRKTVITINPESETLPISISPFLIKGPLEYLLWLSRASGEQITTCSLKEISFGFIDVVDSDLRLVVDNHLLEINENSLYEQGSALYNYRNRLLHNYVDTVQWDVPGMFPCLFVSIFLLVVFVGCSFHTGSSCENPTEKTLTGYLVRLTKVLSQEKCGKYQLSVLLFETFNISNYLSKERHQRAKLRAVALTSSPACEVSEVCSTVVECAGDAAGKDELRCDN